MNLASTLDDDLCVTMFDDVMDEPLFSMCYILIFEIFIFGFWDITHYHVTFAFELHGHVTHNTPMLIEFLLLMQ